MKKPKTGCLPPVRNDIYTPEACFQRRLRIRLALAAYAYEFDDFSMMSDGDFDAMSLLVDTNIDTGAPDLDFFFSEEFNPSTGQWIHKHPELKKVERLYHHVRYYLGADKMTRLYPLDHDEENPYDI